MSIPFNFKLNKYLLYYHKLTTKGQVPTRICEKILDHWPPLSKLVFQPRVITLWQIPEWRPGKAPPSKERSGIYGHERMLAGQFGEGSGDR
jgi:hypothetical protein